MYNNINLKHVARNLVNWYFKSFLEKKDIHNDNIHSDFLAYDIVTLITN